MRALMSMWLAKCGASSSRLLVRILTTPAGMSLVARTSAKVIAGRGEASEASMTTALAPRMALESMETSGTSGGRVGAHDADDASRLES